MSYDADKTAEILDQVRSVLRDGDAAEALRLLRQADSTRNLRPDGDALDEVLGREGAERLAAAMAFEACPYCRAGREECEDCGGRGSYGERACRPCAGLGLRRCPFCNGTGFAGYDFAPGPLRPRVVSARLAFVLSRLEGLAKKPLRASDEARVLARRVIDLDQLRGVLANAVEFVATRSAGAPGTRALYPAAGRAHLLRNCRRTNERAEAAIREALGLLAEHYGRRAGADRNGAKRTLHAHRARHFQRLGSVKGFAGSALETPRALV